MKKIFYFIASAIVALGAVACQNDLDETINPESKGVSFYAEVEGLSRITIGEQDENGYPVIWEEGDQLEVNTGEKIYFFEYDGEKFTCYDEGVENIVGKNVLILYYSSIYGLDSTMGKSGLYLSTGNEIVFSPDKTIKLEVVGSFLRFASEHSVTLSMESEKAYGNPFIYNGGYHNSITLEAGEDIWVPFYIDTPTPPYCEYTLSASIDGEVIKSTTVKLEQGKIYNLGTITVPSKEWCVSGGFNDWDESPLYIEDNMFVARNITLNAEGFQFRSVGGWTKQVGASSTAPTIGKWYKSKYTTDGYKNNITVSDTSKTYDLYLLDDPDYAYFCIVEHGEAAPVAPELPDVNLKWGICGSFTGWGQKADIPMTLVDGKWVATNVTVEAGATFKFRYRQDWDLNQKGLSATKAITIGELTSVTGTMNIKIATAGTYDFYLTEDLGSFVVVAAGAGFPSVKEYKLYVYNLVGWSNIAVWAWDSSTNYTGGSWPGKLITDTEVINGHTYSVFTFPANANDKTIDVILNNNNAGAQTPTFSLTVNKDYYYRLEGTKEAPVVITDPNNPLPEVVVEKVARKITVKGPADWSKMNIHFWGGNSGATSWPGAAMTKNADGNFEYTFDKIDDGCTIGIVLNNGSGKQTGDITNVVLNSDLSYEVLNTVTNGKYNWKKL